MPNEAVDKVKYLLQQSYKIRKPTDQETQQSQSRIFQNLCTPFSIFMHKIKKVWKTLDVSGDAIAS
jgi:hypothetical protein